MAKRLCIILCQGENDNGEKRIWTIQDIPGSIHELKVALTEEYSLEGSFKLELYHADFEIFAILQHIEEVQHLSRLKVIMDAVPVKIETAEATGSQETINSPLRVSQGTWPDPFPLPLFEPDIRECLTQDGETPLLLGKNKKSRMLFAIAGCIFDLKPYPTSSEIASVAMALVEKYPLLKDKVGKGHESWANSIAYKVNAYRGDMRKMGKKEVLMNGKRKSKLNPEGLPSAKKIKKPRRGEVNYLPQYPALEDHTSLGIHQKWLEGELEKGRPNEAEVSRRMAITFAMRREEILAEPPLATFVQRWPAIRMTSQVRTNIGVTGITYIASHL